MRTVFINPYFAMPKDVLSVLIIEDESIWSAILERCLRDFGFEVSGIADTFDKAITLLDQQNYDIILLDIRLNDGRSGLEIAKQIHTRYKKPFIFVTASDSSDILEEAVETHPSGYLSKPLTINSLFITIQNAIRNFQNQQTPPATAATQPVEDACFYVKQGNGYVKVEWADVAGLSVEQNYTRLLTVQNPAGYLIRSTLQKTLDFVIPASIRKDFIRVSRAEVVRLSYIEELRGQTVITSVKTFAITESFMKEVKQKLHLLS